MQKKVFDGLQVLLASPEDIKGWSHGAVENSDTINYRTGKPKARGLFCEAIFGPMKNFECSCGKYKGVRYKGIVCERCGVEVTTSRVRRERMGHIDLAAPVVHIWYIKATPSRVGLLLNLSVNEIEKILYYVKYVVTAIHDKQKKNIVTSLEKDYEDKIGELDGIYAAEVINLVESSSTKKPKEITMAEDELRKLYATNKVELEREYSRVKSILANLKVGSTILESDYRNIFYKYETAFIFVSGSQAILTLLKQVDVEKTIQELIVLFPKSKGEERKKLFKKLKLLINLFISGVQPERMVLTSLPVIPPDLRPVVQLEGGKFASSDVNQFYRRVLMRNLRLKRMIQVGMPDVVKKNEIRLLQESVNNLLVGEKQEAGKGAGAKVFKALTDMLSGKEGIFRKNLLGKRVDYSGRSVITVGPNLKLDECGLPLYIAVKIFTPFIIGKLIERKIAHTPKQAEKLIKEENAVALNILEEVIKDKYVLLNRAPTLHRLSIQAFKIKLMPGKTVRIHPLVVTAFNADFDGDQMAVHLPLSEEAQLEAHTIISSAQNVLAPASGEPSIIHSQDTVLGTYYLTDDTRMDKPLVGAFTDVFSVESSYNAGNLHVHDRIKVKIQEQYIETTVGRVILCMILPKEIKFKNEKIGKKSLKKILDEVFDICGREETVRVADALKDLGFKYATKSSTTINVFDLTLPAAKPEILEAADERVANISNLRYKGFLSDDEKHRLVIHQWMSANQEIAKLVKLEYHPGESLYRMVDSGARGTWGQLTQLAGMKGLVVSPSGEIIELPVKSSLLEGFRPIEYFISAHSARKGKADTALRTAESGYLTRRLVDSSQEVVVREYDCGTQNTIVISKDEAETRQENFSDLILGRVLGDDIVDSRGVTIAIKGTMIDRELLKLIIADDIEYIKARSSLTCRTTSGVCQQCFGMDLSTRKLIEVGVPIGVISSQSIGEPGTQLTMRTFHQEKSMAEGDITHGIRRVEELFEVRNPKKPAIIAPFDGTISIEEGAKKTDVDIISEPIPKTYILKPGYVLSVNIGEKMGKGGVYAEKGRSKLMIKEEGVVQEIHSEYIVVGTMMRAKRKLAVGTTLKVKHGAEVYKGQLLSTGQIDIREYMQIVSDIEAQRYIVKEIKKVYTSQGQNVNDKYMEIIVKQLFSKVVIEDAGQSSFVPGSLVKYEEYVKVNEELQIQGKIIAKGTRLALGLTNIAKETDSWLSAASFQETIRVMVEASTKGSIDRLDDLKSNVIIGRLLPVGHEFRKRYFGENYDVLPTLEGDIVDIVEEDEILEQVGTTIYENA